MGEIALLSRRRPLLAFLLALGSPVLDSFPAFVYEDPANVMEAPSGGVPSRL